MKKQDADLFETYEKQIRGMYNEISLLSKKKPDAPVNKFKLKFINEILKKVNNLLGSKYMPFDGFTVFDEDELPTVSDVVFMLYQYLRCMDKFSDDELR